MKLIGLVCFSDLFLLAIGGTESFGWLLWEAMIIRVAVLFQSTYGGISLRVNYTRRLTGYLSRCGQYK